MEVYMAIRETDCIAKNIELVKNVRKNMPDTTVLCEVSDFFKIMGDFTRIRLLAALDCSEMCLCDLSVLLNMTKSALSHQLKALRIARLIKARKSGKHVFYSLNDEHVKTVLETALAHVKE